MKLLIAVAAAFFLVSPIFAQAPNPFVPKGKALLPAETSAITRAIVVRSDTARFSGLTQIPGSTYRVIIGNDLYYCSGVGPSASGIYNVELHESYVHVNIFHLGVKPPEIYHLHIERVQYNQADSKIAPTQPQVESVDGRRLVIYDRANEGGNTVFRAVTVDRQTGQETYFLFSGFTRNILPGVYDFKIVTVENRPYLDLLTNPKGTGPIWIRLNLSVVQVVNKNNPVGPAFTKQNYEGKL